MIVKLKKVNEDVKIPTRGSEYAAGYDLHAYIPGGDTCLIRPHTIYKISTGICAEIPDGYFGAIFARSGLATKQGLRPANCVGVVDSDYRGEIVVALYNDSDMHRLINNGDRIAQLVIMPYMNAEFECVDALSDTTRGDGGFGSTGY